LLNKLSPLCKVELKIQLLEKALRYGTLQPDDTDELEKAREEREKIIKEGIA
jgi:hypothetical protein